VAVISPDGRRIAFIASTANKQSKLYTHRFDENAPVAIERTEDAATPFFSPDGKWIGFLAGGKLYKVPADSGLPVVIAEVGVTQAMGATWTPDEYIITSLGLSGGLVRIDTRDGSQQVVTTLDGKTENSHRWPQILPGGKSVLFSGGMGGGFEDGSISVQRLDTGERKVLHRGATFGRYLPTGHLAFVAKGTLFAVPFDLSGLQVTGPPVQIFQNLKYAPDSGGAQFDVSRNGTLVHRQADAEVGEQAVFKIDVRGSRTQLLSLPGTWLLSPILSPDGTKVAMLKAEGANRQLWVFDMARDVSRRLTFDTSSPIRARWSPDGLRVIYGMRGGGIFWQRADGSGTAARLSEHLGRPVGMTPDGLRLLYIGGNGLDSRCWVAPIEGKEDEARLGKEELCFSGSQPIAHCDLSPDGKWLAYVTPESGRFEVYVRTFPDTGAKWIVSDGGGSVPEWSRNSNELFFLSLDEQMMAASYRVESGSFIISRPRPWVAMPTPLIYAIDRQYSLMPDGKGMVVVAPINERAGNNAQVNVMLNFFDEVKRKMSERGASQ
jgi:Tol biopolymer transport system component